jgi:chromosome segregation ATPase
VSGAQTRLAAIGGRVDALSKEAQKLSQRAAAADEEMSRGYQKLRAARAELQRLKGAVAKSERAAEAVLSDLRVFRKAAGATELRADAAQKVAALRSQRAAVAKDIHWISKKDV